MLLAISRFSASSVASLYIYIYNICIYLIVFQENLIGGYDADLPPACMVLGRIQDQKQKYNLEWQNTMKWAHLSKNKPKQLLWLLKEHQSGLNSPWEIDTRTATFQRHHSQWMQFLPELWTRTLALLKLWWMLQFHSLLCVWGPSCDYYSLIVNGYWNVPIMKTCMIPNYYWTETLCTAHINNQLEAPYDNIQHMLQLHHNIISACTANRVHKIIAKLKLNTIANNFSRPAYYY